MPKKMSGKKGKCTTIIAKFRNEQTPEACMRAMSFAKAKRRVSPINSACAGLFMRVIKGIATGCEGETTLSHTSDEFRRWYRR